jgi:hypothetical protein
MEQIKHKIGDLVYIVRVSDECMQDFKIAYGSIVSIYHDMNIDTDEPYIITGQEDYDDYEDDTIEYEVLISTKKILNVFSYHVFSTIQDALDHIRKLMQRRKTRFENVFNLEVASDTE